MYINIEIFRGALLARPVGELDLASADSFRTALDNALDDNKVGHLIVNLSGISYIDSSGLGVLLGRYKRVASSGGRVSLVAARPQVRKILELSGLLRIMGEYNSEEEALSRAG